MIRSRNGVHNSINTTDVVNAFVHCYNTDFGAPWHMRKSYLPETFEEDFAEVRGIYLYLNLGMHRPYSPSWSHSEQLVCPNK